MSIIDYPVDEDYKKVNPFVTLFEEPLVIFQGYNRTTKDSVTDLFGQSTTSFSLSLDSIGSNVNHLRILVQGQAIPST